VTRNCNLFLLVLLVGMYHVPIIEGHGVAAYGTAAHTMGRHGALSEKNRDSATNADQESGVQGAGKTNSVVPEPVPVVWSTIPKAWKLPKYCEENLQEFLGGLVAKPTDKLVGDVDEQDKTLQALVKTYINLEYYHHLLAIEKEYQKKVALQYELGHWAYCILPTVKAVIQDGLYDRNEKAKEIEREGRIICNSVVDAGYAALPSIDTLTAIIHAKEESTRELLDEVLMKKALASKCWRDSILKSLVVSAAVVVGYISYLSRTK
jgi:hypothetical protein